MSFLSRGFDFFYSSINFIKDALILESVSSEPSGW